MKILKRLAYQCPFCDEQENTIAVNVEEDGFNRYETWNCLVCEGEWHSHYTITFEGVLVDDKMMEVFEDEHN